MKEEPYNEQVKCCSCGGPGVFAQYPGPIPVSMAFCTKCYVEEREAYEEFRLRHPFQKLPSGHWPFTKKVMTSLKSGEGKSDNTDAG